MVINIKKKRIVMLSIAMVALFVSMTTVVPQIDSKPVMKTIEVIENQRQKIGNKIDLPLAETLQLNGILEWIMQLLRTIIQLIFRLIEVIQDIIGIVNLIRNLIEALQVLIQLIQQLIELITDIFPSVSASNYY